MKRNPYLNYTRLPMENAYNVRELGGYATKKGSITMHHQFLRSENLTDITEEDKTFLIEYGLSGIIDLRSREEALIYPNPFRGNNAVKYINCPLITDGILDLRAVKEVGFDPGEFYVKLVEYKEMLYKIFHFILDNIDGCLLFHCQAGKDRTGVLAMILMGLAGVSKEDIVANYEVTHTYLKENVKLRLEDGLEELEFSKPQWIEKAYDHIIEHYGSFKVYLMAVGLTKKEIKKIRRKLQADIKKLVLVTGKEAMITGILLFKHRVFSKKGSALTKI